MVSNRTRALDLDILTFQMRETLGGYANGAEIELTVGDEVFNETVEAVEFGKHSKSDIEGMNSFEYQQSSLRGPKFLITRQKS